MSGAAASVKAVVGAGAEAMAQVAQADGLGRDQWQLLRAVAMVRYMGFS